MVDVEALFGEHDRYLYRVVRRRFPSSVPSALIEDACSAAWAIGWAHREPVRDENPVGWLVTVAWREALARTLAVQVFPISDVKAYMGHADIQTTMIYVHHVPQHDAAEKLSRVIQEANDYEDPRVPRVDT